MNVKQTKTKQQKRSHNNNTDKQQQTHKTKHKAKTKCMAKGGRIARTVTTRKRNIENINSNHKKIIMKNKIKQPNKQTIKH